MVTDRELIQQKINEGACVTPFNDVSAKMAVKRMGVDYNAITDPLNKFMAHGISEYGSEFLVRHDCLPEGHPLFVQPPSMDSGDQPSM